MDMIHYPRQHIHITNRLRDIAEEIEVSRNLIKKLKCHTDSIAAILKSVLCTEKFFKYYSYASSALCKYIAAMAEVNYKLEMVLDGQLSSWNEIYEDYENYIDYMSRQYGDQPMDSHEEADNFEYEESFPDPRFAPDARFTPNSEAYPNPHYRRPFPFPGPEQAGFPYNPSFGAMNDFPQMEGNNMRGYFLPNMNSEMTRHQLRGAPFVNAMETSRAHNRNPYKCNNQYNQPSRRRRGPRLVTEHCGGESASVSKKERNESASNADNEGTLNSSSPGSSFLTEPQKGMAMGQAATANLPKSPNKQYSGHVMYAVSPAELYLCMVKERFSLMHQFQSELEGLKKDKKYKKPAFTEHLKPMIELRLRELGKFALYYSDTENTFFRVEIVDTTLDNEDNLICVYLLDIGRKERVNLKSLYPMTDKLTKYPAFAIKCHLSKVAPNYNALAGIKWTENDLQMMHNWIAENDNVIFVIDEEVDENLKSLPIQLYDTTKANCLNKLLANTQVALASGWSAEEIAVEKWNPMAEAFESTSNVYDLDINDPACAIYGYVSRDYERLCKEYRETGRCFKGISCRKEHLLMDYAGYTRDQEEIYVRAFNNLPAPSPNQELLVQVTNIINGSQFHCVIDESHITERETLLSLVCFMNDKKNVLRMRKLAIPPAVGQIVIARFPQDNSWYRAKVLEALPEEDEYLVLFVDYGNTETLHMSNIRAIEPEYLHLPFQAIFCEMAGIRSAPGMLRETVRYLDEALVNTVKIKVVSALPGERLHLIVRLYRNGDDVGQILLDRKLALPVENIDLGNSEVYLPG